ncbi:ABC transporter ATP-binding protein [Streptococcus pneumoniae]|nr:ABC transporter ATP-binding protein [Streptococcus pneumoniae]
MNFINVKLVGSEIVSDGFRLKVPEGALKYQNCLVQNLTFTAKLVKTSLLQKLMLVTTCKQVQQLSLDLT